MKFSKRLTLFFGLVTGSILLVFLILSQVPRNWTQNVEIEILNKNFPVRNSQIKLVAGHPLGNCNSDGLLGTTDNSGIAYFTRERQKHWLSNFVVIVVSDTICMQEKHEWKVIWASNYGPAPKTLHLICELNLISEPNQNGVISQSCKRVANQN